MNTAIIEQPSVNTHIDYNRIAETYDIINSIFTMGLIKHWRKEVSYFLSNHGPLRILDIGSGSGEQIISFFKTNLEIISVNGIDPSEKMVEIARKKISCANLNNCVIIESGDASTLRFHDSFFDAVTISFALRDIEKKNAVFKEVHRVLKGDCPFIILDIPNPSGSKLNHIFSWYIKYIFSVSGGLWSGFPNIYKMLWKNLNLLPHTEILCNQLKATGFQKLNTLSLFAGAAIIISGKKRVH